MYLIGDRSPTVLLGITVVVLGVRVIVGVISMLVVITLTVEVKVGVRRVVAVTEAEETLIVYLGNNPC